MSGSSAMSSYTSSPTLGLLDTVARNGRGSLIKVGLSSLTSLTVSLACRMV